MNQTLKNIKRVYLTAVELPFSNNNIKTGSTDTLIFVLNGTTFNCIIPEGNYTATTLSQAITNYLASNYLYFGPVSISFSMFGTKSLFNVFGTGVGGTGLSSFSITETLFSKNILGFRSTDTFVGNNFQSLIDFNLNLNSDPYILMYIPTLNGLNASQSGKQSTFKIPMNIQSTGVNPFYYHLDAKTFKQFVDITDPQLTISNLTVILYDRYGVNINPFGKDFSFTLALELYN
jgi:hypothetical protein